MRGFRFILTFALSVALAGSARAGIYCSLDQLPYPVPTTFGAVNSKLADVRGPVNIEKNAQQRKQEYLRRADELEAKKKAGALTLDERIDLSGVYLRLQRNDEAIHLLLPFVDENNFLVLTHLATAYHLQAQPLWDRAIGYQQQALKAWPAVSLRWNLEQLNWYRRVEQYYLELLRLRRQEALNGAGRQAPEAVDTLFPRLQFEMPEGGYELGGPTKRIDRLTEDAPQDALSVVVQLMFWLPIDNRLIWLYGELLNQRGDVVNAEKVLEELETKRKYSPRKVHLHHRALQYGVELWQNRHLLLWTAQPPMPFAVPGGGALGLEASMLIGAVTAKKADDPAYLTALEATGRQSSEPQPPIMRPTAKDEGNSWLPDWRTVVVSFLAGMMVMALILLQWREWSRRRESAMSTRRQLTS